MPLGCLILKEQLQAIIFDRHYRTTMAEISFTPQTISVEALFEQAFKSHFKRLHIYALTIVKDDVIAEEMVQNVFFKLWEKNREIVAEQSVTAYLYRAVHNESLNYLKHQQVRQAYQTYIMKQGEEDRSGSRSVTYRELEAKLESSLKELPEQCRTVFQMSRFEGLKYREIADRLNVSVKTIEKQMGKALKILRVQLAEHLPASLILLLLTF